MKHVSPLDNSFLEIETDSIQANIGGVSIFEGPAPPQAALMHLVASKLERVPRYRQRVRRLPLRVGMPVWVDDTHFNLAYHLRRTALPAPGGPAQLDALVGRVMSQHLDRTKPLWETWVVEGIAGGRWGLLWKVHHAMVDGVSANDLMTEVLDTTPTSRARRARAWSAEQISGARFAAESARGLLAPFEELVAGARGARPATLAARGIATARAVIPAVSSLAGRPLHTSLNGPLGPHRVWTRTSVALDDVKRVRLALGATVNDVVLALVTRAVRDLLRSRGEPVEDIRVRTMVPVSVRAESERGTLANRVSAIFAEMPVGIDDPLRRLEDIRAQMQHVKQTHGAVAGDALTGIASFAPPMLLALGARLLLRTPQRWVNTVVTNVPGPQRPLYCVGRRMTDSWPYVMLGARVRVATAIFSYDGTLYFGITGDLATANDVPLMARAIRAGMKELLVAAARKER